jgi:hypothetical protein
MKKFYLSIFTAVCLLFTLITQAQPYATTYQTVPNDGNYHSLTDPASWLPPNGFPPQGCTSCDIIVNCLSTVDFIPGYFQYFLIQDSRLTLEPGLSIAFNSGFQLINSKIYIGIDGTSPDTLLVNNTQLLLDDASSIILANPFTYADVRNLKSLPVTGYVGSLVAYFDPTPTYIPGILTNSVFPGYGPFPGDPLGSMIYQYAYTLTSDGIGSPEVVSPEYDINCGNAPGGFCGPGFVFGPATTTTIIDPPTVFTPASNTRLEFTPSPILPVDLVQFLASMNSDGTVKVSWATAQEQNSNYFDVERSGNQEGWAKIGSVKAKGYSSITSNYSLTDRFPLDGTGYYRLKMVDLDGKFKYSKTVAVSSNQDNRPLVIYNNPFTDQIRLKVNVARGQSLVMTVSDMVGKTYINQTYQAQAGDNFVNLQPNIGSSGMYVLRIHGDSYDQTAKIEKQ